MPDFSVTCNCCRKWLQLKLRLILCQWNHLQLVIATQNYLLLYFSSGLRKKFNLANGDERCSLIEEMAANFIMIYRKIESIFIWLYLTPTGAVIRADNFIDRAGCKVWLTQESIILGQIELVKIRTKSGQLFATHTIIILNIFHELTGQK